MQQSLTIAKSRMMEIILSNPKNPEKQPRLVEPEKSWKTYSASVDRLRGGRGLLPDERSCHSSLGIVECVYYLVH